MTMKPFLFPLTIYLMVWLLGCGQENPIVEPPMPNADSIRCVQAWQKFQLPKDTILTLRYQQPVKIGNGTDTMTITVTQIDDWCTEESLKDTDGCEARVKFQMTLNGHCTYQNKYGLMIRPRSAKPTFQNFVDIRCSYYSSDVIYDGPADVVLAFHNTLITLNQLTPFAKNLQEFNDLIANKQKYTVTVWLKKRCL